MGLGPPNTQDTPTPTNALSSQHTDLYIHIYNTPDVIVQITVENARTLEWVEMRDVYFGEVWLCSGQSNMQVRGHKLSLGRLCVMCLITVQHAGGCKYVELVIYVYLFVCGDATL